MDFFVAEVTLNPPTHFSDDVSNRIIDEIVQFVFIVSVFRSSFCCLGFESQCTNAIRGGTTEETGLGE